MARNTPRSQDRQFGYPLDHSRDDAFDPDASGPDAVAEDPAVFRRADSVTLGPLVTLHPLKSLRPDGPGHEASLHDIELEFRGLGGDGLVVSSEDDD